MFLHQDGISYKMQSEKHFHIRVSANMYTEMKMVRYLFLLLSLILFSPNSAFASDWGYDDVSPPETKPSIKPMKATPMSIVNPKQSSRANSRSKSKKVPAKFTPRTKPARFVAPGKTTAEYAWLQIFGLIRPVAENGKMPDINNLTAGILPEQKAKYLDYIRRQLKKGPESGFNTITKYWPKLFRSMRESEERKENYRLLFRALMRMKAEEADIIPDDRAILLEAIGPTMFASNKEPKLSHEAVKAYSDMACFLYSQTHPGKTVDGDDNRKLFALVIKDKFNKAPGYTDRLAMSYFPINWAKFRILYTDASEQERQILVRKLAHKDSKASDNQSVKNELLESVLCMSPWKDIILNAKKRTKLVGQQAKVKAILGDF